MFGASSLVNYRSTEITLDLQTESKYSFYQIVTDQANLLYIIKQLQNQLKSKWPTLIVSIHAFILYNHSRSTYLLLFSSFKILYSSPQTYSLSGLQFAFRSTLFMQLNNCSTGFSQGEYCAFRSTLTLNLRAVSQMELCLWIEALSINTTICFPLVSLSLRSFVNSRWRKLLKTTASVPPSVIYAAITTV